MTIKSAIDELIQKVSASQSQIDELVLQIKTLEKQKIDAREEVECSLLQLHQLQEDFERLCLVDQQRQDQLVELNRQVVSNLADLEQQKQDFSIELAKEKQDFSIELEKQKQDFSIQLAKEKGELVATHAKELDDMRNAVNELRQEVFDQNAELEKVMEELEHYFVHSREQSIMLQEHVNLQERATALIANSLS